MYKLEMLTSQSILFFPINLRYYHLVLHIEGRFHAVKCYFLHEFIKRKGTLEVQYIYFIRGANFTAFAKY